MLLQNPIKEDETRFIKEIDGKYYLGDNELLSLTEEQKKITKTGANYYFKGKENGNEFFCHMNKEKGKFWIAETFNEFSHDVWLANNKSITFYENNIVFRDNDTKESFPFQNEKNITEIIGKQYNELVDKKTFVMFKDTIRNEESYIEKVGDKWFRFNEELKPLSEEQKKITKTGAQYAVTNDKGTFFYHLNEETKEFTLSETVSNLGHEVWLKNRQSINYHEKGIVIKDNVLNKAYVFDTKTDLSDLIDESYLKQKNSNSNKENFSIEKVVNPKQETVANDHIKEKEGFFKELKKELRESSEDSISMTAMYGIKDLLSNGMKKNKFLTLGATAGTLAIVASTPALAGGVLLGGTLLAIGATLHTAIITAMKIDETVTQKLQDLRNNEQATVDSMKERSFSNIKSSINKIRGDSLDFEKRENKKQI